MTGGVTRAQRALPVIALAGVAFAVGAIVGANHADSASQSVASRFVAAWTRADYAAMYPLIDGASRRTTSPSEFAAAYRQALVTATAGGLRVTGSAGAEQEGIVRVPVTVRTRLFGTLALSFMLQVSRRGTEGARVEWSRSSVFPGLMPGERLGRSTSLPPRARLLARDGSVLAEGSPSVSLGEQSRSSPLGEAVTAAVGRVGPIPAARRQSLLAQGVPGDATVGVSGLELALDDRLRGTPGGELLAQSAQETGSGRVLGSAASRPAPAGRTTISPAIQRSAVAALGGQLGGIVAMDPSGRILAVAGIGLNGLQPPGSTFKMITLSGVLQAGIAGPGSVFPYGTDVTLDGVKLSNANGESCGGTLEQAFAASCNSVFSPLGVKLGAPRLVSMAERFGFNHDPGVPGSARSTLPAASAIQGELAVGSTAIGQGQVLATPLEMATVAAAIADRGRPPRPTFDPAVGTSTSAPAISEAVAGTVRRLMLAVVRSGTGTAAAIPGVPVAGKTGTAELKTQCPAGTPEAPSHEEKGASGAVEGCVSASAQASNTDAWFAAFAPASRPRIVVGVLLVKDGAGGETAAPVARQVLEAGLQAGAH
jgi:cell division protein FtsI/penicillin-binding protein 2